MVYFHVGRSEPRWEKEACRSVWWPEEVEFTDVNNSSKRPHLKDLISMMHSYRNWNQQQHPQEVDIAVDDSAYLLLLSLFSSINFIVLVVINFIFYCFHRFSSYVDQSIYELGLESFYSSGDGNCFYNSLSRVMSGHESNFEIFRLGADVWSRSL